MSNVPSTKLGSTSAMESVASRGAFRANMYVMDDGASVTALSITSLLRMNADVGATTAVDEVIDPVVAAMLVAASNVTAAVRVFRSAD